MFIDKKFRIPRIWSNRELKKFSEIFSGKILNSSGWKDQDKEGNYYKDYYNKNISEYWISNYRSDARGFQGNQVNEFFLNLEKDLRTELVEKFDVVFNHTVLEHVFEINKAFSNLCTLSKDIVIITVPFLQEQHAQYGDYWRFTPLALKKLFEKNSLEMIYINYNDDADSSIYIFAIGSKKPSRWISIKNNKDNKIHEINDFMLGTKIIDSSYIKKIINYINSKISKI